MGESSRLQRAWWVFLSLFTARRDELLNERTAMSCDYARVIGCSTEEWFNIIELHNEGKLLYDDPRWEDG
jgi:hypothetical protein